MLKEKRKLQKVSFFSISAEDEGFKPPIPCKGYTGFRVQRIRSLCQSSFLETLPCLYERRRGGFLIHILLKNPKKDYVPIDVVLHSPLPWGGREGVIDVVLLTGRLPSSQD